MNVHSQFGGLSLGTPILGSLLRALQARLSSVLFFKYFCLFGFLLGGLLLPYKVFTIYYRITLFHGLFTHSPQKEKKSLESSIAALLISGPWTGALAPAHTC